MGVPGEARIKAYRSTTLPASGFDTLKEYAKNFMESLHSENIDFPVDAEKGYIYRFTERFTGQLLGEIQGRIREQSSGARAKGSNPDEVLVEEISKKIILKYHNESRKRKPLLPIEEGEAAICRCEKEVNNIITDMVGKSNLPPKLISEIRQTLPYAFVSSLLYDICSGVVIAGFGEKEFAPSVEAYIVEGIVQSQQKDIKGILKYQIEGRHLHGKNIQAGIIPFAQENMVHRFMRGVDPDYQKIEYATLTKLFESYTRKVIKQLDKYNDAEKEHLREQLGKIAKEMQDGFEKHMRELAQQEFSNPIVTAVGNLSKNELAAMAEALVQLTSLKRKVSLDLETVAEPIDVAVVSKGDGFIWIKRKHYFDPELNPSFFLRRFKEVL
jgi:hypothetical protein